MGLKLQASMLILRFEIREYALHACKGINTEKNWCKWHFFKNAFGNQEGAISFNTKIEKAKLRGFYECVKL